MTYITIEKEKLESVLEALEANQPINYCLNNNGERFPMMQEDPFRFEANTKAITAIKEALAQPEEAQSALSLFQSGFIDGREKGLKEALAQPEQEIIPLNIEDEYVRDYLWDRALVAIDDPCARSHPHENMGAYCKHRTELARIQAQELDKNDEIAIAYGLPKEPEQEPVAWYHAEDYKTHFTTNPSPDLIGKYWKPLYTTPPQRTFVGLTDDEIRHIYICTTGWSISDSDPMLVDFAENIESKLRSKNGY